MRLVSGNTGMAAITRCTLSSPIRSGNGVDVGTGVAVAADTVDPSGVAVGLKVVRVAVGCGPAATVAGACVAAAVVGAGALVAPPVWAVGAGALVASGSSPPQATIIVAKRATIDNEINVKNLKGRILCTIVLLIWNSYISPNLGDSRVRRCHCQAIYANAPPSISSPSYRKYEPAEELSL